MKTKVSYFIILVSFTFQIQNGFAQSAKKLFKMGNDYNKSGNYEMAVEKYSKAIEIDNKFVKAIEARALAYEQLMDYKNAAEDFEALTELQPKIYTNAVKAAGYFFKIGEFKRANDLIENAEEIAPELPDIYSLKAKCLYALQKYTDAKKASDRSIKLNATHDNYYIRGLINIELNNLSDAESDFRASLKLKPDFSDASLQLATVLNILGKQDEALIALNALLEKEIKNQKAYLLRGKIYLDRLDFKEAIDDFSNASRMSTNQEVFYLRGIAYMHDNQINAAIDDFSKTITLQKDNLNAYENRALCYQKLNKKTEAARDFDYVVMALANSNENREMLERCKAKLIEVKRENNRPNIYILDKNNLELQSVEAAEGLYDISIRIKILDENEISNLSINKVPVPINKDSIKTGQLFKISIQNKTNIEIEAEDTYQNKTSATCKIVRKDEGLPKIALSSQYVNESGKIYLKSLDPEILIEGKIFAKNFIDSIQVNNRPAIFDSGTKNPTFKVKVDISGIDNLSFLVIDNQGNVVQKNLSIDRSDAALLSDNPMGRTWVVFVENSEYKTFSNLDGPKKEIDLMIKALSKYKIDKILHKKNLTKRQMEYFFNHELKDLVVENRVNSLLIWYAGHGKFSDQNGYWIPVDSKIDDVSTYFNINSLKNSIKPYVQNITHSLVITDACETGPSFYMSMRNLSSDRNCSDSKSTKFKSSQVFTSSGYDLTEGNSKFTSSFANSLMFDNNSCVPIERIVNKVTTDVYNANKIKPKFGKISGFEDENGTFIFIKK